MQHFTIRDIENLTGIKAHTLRMWEQRYGLLASKHTAYKHRTYNNDDLKKLLRIAFLYHQGIKISTIALMNEKAVLKKVEATQMELSNYQLYIFQLVEASVDFNERQFTKILDDLIAVIGFEKCISEVGYPFLKRIGMLWVTSHIIPAQEHFASHLLQNKIIAKTEALPAANKDQPAIVLFTPDGEHHEMPLLFINYLLKKYGWNTVYLGYNVKLPTIEQLQKVTDIGYLYTHVITNFTGLYIDDYFESLCTTFREVKIVASGAVVATLQRSFINCTVLASDDAIYRFIRHNPYLET